MKKIATIIVLLPLFSLAQVGVNTTTPLQGVHVAKTVTSDAKVRIEGLNAPNNVKNLGAGNTSRVFVNNNGDLVLGDIANETEVIFDEENYLDDPRVSGGAQANQINQTGQGFGYTIAGWPRVPAACTFTLTKPAIIEVNYSLSFGRIEKNTDSFADDGNARIFQCYMYLRRGGPAGPVINNDLDGNPIGLIGANGQFITNANDMSGEVDNYHNTGTDYIKLPAGTYCPMFAAQLAVSTTVGVGAVKTYIGTGKDEVQVIAHYYN